uniref:Uncharacterized protein n=1 Tax=Globisporangium ultimum (strain ATCC 200006 / CBS 805.95 / DAOM BR144) TaxID=431595 RepID=K3WWV2_GLOUD
RGRANAPELTTGQHRLEQIGRIHRAGSLASTQDQVHLIDKQDDLAIAVLHFLQHSLQALFKFAAVLGTGDQGSHIKTDDLTIERFRDISDHDSLGQSLNNRRFANTRLTDENWVVLGSSRQNADDATDLFITSNHRVDLASCREFNEVLSVFVERIVHLFRIAAGHGATAA